MFDDGEYMSEHLDWSKANRPGLEPRSLSVNLPAWMIASLDNESRRLGVSRDDLIRMVIADRLDRVAS